MSNRVKMKSTRRHKAVELEKFVNEAQAALLDCALKKFLEPSSFVRETVDRIWDSIELVESEVYMQSIRLMLLAVIKGEFIQSVLPELLDKVHFKAQEVLGRNGNEPLESTLDSILSSTREGFMEVVDMNAQEMLHRITLAVAEQKYGQVTFRQALRTWRVIE